LKHKLGHLEETNVTFQARVSLFGLGGVGYVCL
jgi:hypothetical protein